MLRLPRSQSRRQRSGALYLGNVDNRSLPAALRGELNRSALDVVSDDVNLIRLSGGKAGKEIAAVARAEELDMELIIVVRHIDFHHQVGDAVSLTVIHITPHFHQDRGKILETLEAALKTAYTWCGCGNRSSSPGGARCHCWSCCRRHGR